MWAYFDQGPKFSIGMGVGSGGYAGAAGGVRYDERYNRLDEARRIVFDGDIVISLESRTE